MTKDVYDFDLFVIGAGSGGVRAARMAAQRGVRVCVAEAAALGGTCVNVGCIPKKLYSYAAHYADAFEEARGFGWVTGAPVLDWERLKARRAAEVLRLNGVYQGLLEGAGVTIVQGWASLLDEHAVQVQTQGGRRTFTAHHILLATGGTPSVPDIPGSEYAVSSDAMFDLARFPKRLVVVGGGYIACEFASIFNGLGARVTQLCRGPQLLRGFDDEIREFIAQEMSKAGINVRRDTQLSSISSTTDGLELTLADGGRLRADTVLFATGRVPNVTGLGLEALGVARGRDGAILVDEGYRSSLHSVYALGDVTARVQLTPVALGEAMVLVDRLFGPAQRFMSYDYIPTAVFTHPNIGTVGFGEAQAREKFGRVTVYRGSGERMFENDGVDGSRSPAEADCLG
ncbi:hypothetical protein M527_01325 [Sphingobium indicum IP26]